MEKLKIHILKRLYRYTYVGRRHTSIDNLKQGLPKEKRVMKDIRNAVKELVNEGYLLVHHTDRVSLNPRMLGEIKEIVSRTIRG